MGRTPKRPLQDLSSGGLKFRQSKFRQFGVSLTELLLCLSLFIPVVALIAGMFPYSYSVDRAAWSQRTAQSLAYSTLEQARGSKFEDVLSSVSTHQNDGKTYRIELQVQDSDEEPIREKQLTCTVTWAKKNGTETLTLETRLSRYYGNDSI